MAPCLDEGMSMSNPKVESSSMLSSGLLCLELPGRRIMNLLSKSKTVVAGAVRKTMDDYLATLVEKEQEKSTF